MNLDHLARQSYKDDPSSVIYWLIMSSYLYYIRMESVLSDETFDKMCKLVLDKNIKHSKLQYLVNDDRLRAGSFFDVKPTEYPDFIIEDAEKLLRYGTWYGSKING